LKDQPPGQLCEPLSPQVIVLEIELELVCELDRQQNALSIDLDRLMKRFV
jgi:hypothetical protein